MKDIASFNPNTQSSLRPSPRRKLAAGAIGLSTMFGLTACATGGVEHLSPEEVKVAQEARIDYLKEHCDIASETVGGFGEDNERPSTLMGLANVAIARSGLNPEDFSKDAPGRLAIENDIRLLNGMTTDSVRADEAYLIPFMCEPPEK